MPHENSFLFLRIHQIDDLIRSGTYPNKTLMAEKFGVSLRTIARDLDMLRDRYDAKLKFDYNKNGYYYEDDNFFLKYVNLKEGDLISLTLFDRMLEQYRNTPLEDQLRKIFRKITDSLPENVNVDASFLSSEITYISDVQPVIDQEIFKSVMESLKTRRILEIEYQNSSSESSLREIDPHHVVCKGGSWYVLAFCHKRNEIRLFSMSRIKKAKVKATKFKQIPGFKVEDYIDPAFGVFASERKLCEIKFICKNGLALTAEEYKWHPNQKIVKNSDGTVTVSFSTTQLTAAAKLILGFGKNAVVLEPPELRKQIIETAKGVLENYS